MMGQNAERKSMRRTDEEKRFNRLPRAGRTTSSSALVREHSLHSDPLHKHHIPRRAWPSGHRLRSPRKTQHTVTKDFVETRPRPPPHGRRRLPKRSLLKQNDHRRRQRQPIEARETELARNAAVRIISRWVT